MEQPLQSETTKLSLVGQHGRAVDVASPQYDFESAEDVATRLPAVLQTSLDLNTIISSFNKEVSKVMSYDGMLYQHQGVHCDIQIGRRSHHTCNYRLEINSTWLGDITLTRRSKFTNDDTLLFEDLLCKLIYPVRNSLLLRQAQSAALQDSLTGLNNRGAFDASLKREIDLANRQHTPMSLLILDIDHFKVINDTYGHSSGDLALQTLAKSITDTMRNSDIAFRYGGEEFTLILSNTDSESAHLVAERLRTAISQLSCNAGQHSFGFTISLGIAQIACGENGKALFDRADSALFQAKKTGRNQTQCADKLSSKDN